MLRVTIVVLILVQAISMACAAKIPLSRFKSRVYREPPVSGDARGEQSIQAPVLEYLEQNLDNFDPTNDATWQMVCPNFIIHKFTYLTKLWQNKI